MKRPKIAVLCVLTILLISGCTILRDIYQDSGENPFPWRSEDVSVPNAQDRETETTPPSTEAPWLADERRVHALQGRTLLISIFADDSVTSWDYDSEGDAAMIQDTLDNLRISTQYLKEQVARYGQTAAFYYDWEQFDDLAFVASFDAELVREDGGMYLYQRN